MGFLFFILSLTGANVALSIVTARRTCGVWRWVALAPIPGLVCVVANIIIGILRNPTAHNLWPFEILMTAGFGLVFALVFLGVQYLVNYFKKERGRERGRS
jgi:hypothetical protein